MKVEPIKLDPIEIISNVAFTIAYCIGAAYDDDEAQRIADSIPDEFIQEVITLIRERAKGAME